MLIRKKKKTKKKMFLLYSCNQFKGYFSNDKNKTTDLSSIFISVVSKSSLYHYQAKYYTPSSFGNETN